MLRLTISSSEILSRYLTAARKLFPWAAAVRAYHYAADIDLLDRDAGHPPESCEYSRDHQIERWLFPHMDALGPRRDQHRRPDCPDCPPDVPGLRRKL